jgi:hypothetical protein
VPLFEVLKLGGRAVVHGVAWQRGDLRPEIEGLDARAALG